MYTEKLWVTNPTKLKRLMELPIGHDALIQEELTSSTNLDMSVHGWIEVGKVTHDYYLELTDKQTQAAMAAFEMAERKILDDYTSKMKELQQAKQEFLSLPAPKAQND